MKHNREFEIAWQGLKPGIHTYTYDIDSRFMKDREVDESFTGWKASVTLKFDKHENFFMLHFDVDGKVTVPCDRCGDDFDLRLWDEFNLVIKLTGEESEAVSEDDDEDVIFIPRSETVIDISSWIYEFLMLSVPLQHIHPESEGGQGCNPEALDLLDKLSEQNDQVQNPLWKGLDKFK
ncbi:MAG: DUF177 domain-containing protein [Taibaiella sp.]|nr:DUF177 domain-containing protein [Taibaiella sp.]